MLNRIAAEKILEVQRLRRTIDIDKLIIKTKSFNPFTVFKNDTGRIEVIAEVKKASPIKGVICSSFNHLEIAKKYELKGAAAVSVISDSKFFDGKADYLREIREEIDLPILRKDFIIDEIQLYETMEMGADMVLLIAAMHDYSSLLNLCEISRQIGLEPLLEVHDADEIGIIPDLPINIIGVNNRNLKDFTVDINTSIKLSSLIPDAFIKISESGIKTQQDMILLEQNGFNAVLIGETLVSSPDPGAKLDELLKYREMKSYDQS